MKVSYPYKQYKQEQIWLGFQKATFDKVEKNFEFKKLCAAIIKF